MSRLVPRLGGDTQGWEMSEEDERMKSAAANSIGLGRSSGASAGRSAVGSISDARMVDSEELRSPNDSELVESESDCMDGVMGWIARLAGGIARLGLVLWEDDESDG